MLGQISLITLLLWVSYSKLFINWGLTEGMGEHRPFYISLVLSLLTLPMPRRFCCFFITEMYVLQVEEDVDEDEDEERQGMKGNQETDADNDGAESKREHAELKKEEKKEMESRPALFDKYLQLKCVCIVFIFILWIITICVTYFLADYSGSNADFEKGDLYTFVELTEDEANEFVMCWYLAIFVWGFLINELRIVIISLLAPIKAQNFFEK